MTDLESKLAPYGIDYADALERVGGSADFYEQLATRYLEDPHFDNLVAAMEVEDFDAGYKEAHALKGVSGNLSLGRLYRASAAVSEALHQGEYQAAEKLMPEVEAAHRSALEGLEKWQNGELQ